jgi:hypothetical protein
LHAAQADVTDHDGMPPVGDVVEPPVWPVVPAKAGLRRQEAEANIRRKTNGAKASAQERAVIHSGFRAVVRSGAKWIRPFASRKSRPD